ncbi:MAG: hypothetical protein HKN18_04620 [Silicimonas sp.]|nr:hypothetical protein [Silicimonas sp.]
MTKSRRDQWVAIVGIGLALILLVFWIRLDIETGLIDVWRRTIRIGDALLPTIGALGMLFSAIWVGVSAFRQIDLDLSPGNSLPFFGIVLAIHAVSFVMMLWVGPVMVSLFAAEGATYRQLLDTIPWKYAGFIAGGTCLIFALKSLLERKMTLHSLGIAIAATVVIAFLYDVPFDTMQLPPNGDF